MTMTHSNSYPLFFLLQSCEINVVMLAAILPELPRYDVNTVRDPNPNPTYKL